MRGKYAEYYWYTKKEKEGHIWTIKAKIGGPVLQSSTEDDDPEDRYFKTAKDAMWSAKETIRDHYTE